MPSQVSDTHPQATIASAGCRCQLAAGRRDEALRTPMRRAIMRAVEPDTRPRGRS